MIFENKGKENTLETLHIALNAAKERGTTLVVASNAGDTLIELIKMQEALGTNVPMVMVGQAYGYPKQGVNTMTDERRAELTAAGVHIIHAAHALSGAERGISRKFSGAYPVEIMAHTLRMFGQGTKVCVEIVRLSLISRLSVWAARRVVRTPRASSRRRIRRTALTRKFTRSSASRVCIKS